MTARKWLAMAMLAVIGLPLCIYIIVQKVQPYWPRSDPRLLTSAQFERVFNEQMAEHGLSVNLSGAYAYNGSRAVKTAKVDCADGGAIVCLLIAEEYRGNTIISEVYFEQPLTGEASETVYLKPLTGMLLNVFEPPMAADRERRGDGDASYNEVMAACDDLLSGKTDEYDTLISANTYSAEGIGHLDRVWLKRSRDEQGEPVSLLAHLRVNFS